MGRREANERDEIVRILKVISGRLAGPDGAAARKGIKRTTLNLANKEVGHRAAKGTVTLYPAAGSFPYVPRFLLLPRTVNSRVDACHQLSTSVEISTSRFPDTIPLRMYLFR